MSYNSYSSSSSSYSYSSGSSSIALVSSTNFTLLGVFCIAGFWFSSLGDLSSLFELFPKLYVLCYSLLIMDFLLKVWEL